MKDEGLEMKYFWGSTLHHVDDLPFKLEDMPTNYGGFKAKAKGLEVRKTIAALDQLKGKPARGDVEPGEIPTLMDLGLKQEALMELVEERNKIIDSSTAQLQKLRTNYQKLQQQNWNLAQSNSHYLAELNLGRDKLKALQHELVCKDALLKAKKLEGKTVVNREKLGSKVVCGDETTEEEPFLQTNVAEKHSNRSQRRIVRGQSLGPTTTNQQVAEKESVENKRRCVRRQSHSFKSSKHEASENLFEIEDAKFPLSSKGCDNEGNNEAASRRASIGRPLRRAAAEKVQSYKETPVNVKMRRPEWA